MCGSSGAHIALLAAYAPHEPNLVPEELRGADTSVVAVVSWYGIPEIASAVEAVAWATGNLIAAGAGSEGARQARQPLQHLDDATTADRRAVPAAPPVPQLIRNLLGVEPGESATAMYDLASPIHHVSPACPPTLMFQGAHDAVVPLEAARRLHRSLEAAGVPVVYVDIWTEHAFDLMYPPLANPAPKAALYDLGRFLVSVAITRREQEPPTCRTFVRSLPLKVERVPDGDVEVRFSGRTALILGAVRTRVVQVPRRIRSFCAAAAASIVPRSRVA